LQSPSNTQSQDPHGRPMNVQQTPNTRSSISLLHNELLPGMAPSSASTVSEEARRSSGGLSLPPQSASDLNRGASKTRPSTSLTYLTQAQRDAWDRHQAARAGSNTRSTGNSANTSSNANAKILFGGVDSLVEESQDWWLKDQSALALGFDNWIDPNTDWAGQGLGSTFGIGDNAASGFSGNNVSTMGALTNANLAGYTYPGRSENGYSTFSTSGDQGSNGGTAYRHGTQDSLDEDMYF
jgi:hypothetical protein